MSFAKNYGPLQLSEAGGNFKVAIDDSVAVGGGSVAGVIEAEGQASATVEGGVLIDAGLEAAAAKYPALAPAVLLFKGLVDAEIAKL